MKAQITIRFGIETSDLSILQRINEGIKVAPSKCRSQFPSNSIAKPFWETEIMEETYELSTVFNALQKRIEPFRSFIHDLQQEYDIHPYYLIIITASFESRPYIALSPAQIDFIHSLGAEMIIDLESVYPDD